jgi:hypothetical protein
MTPKEKAKELVNKFMPFVYVDKSIGEYFNAKNCALIAVDEILAIFYDDYQSMWVRELNFWHLVKNEIEEL